MLKYKNQVSRSPDEVVCFILSDQIIHDKLYNSENKRVQEERIQDEEK